MANGNNSDRRAGALPRVRQGLQHATGLQGPRSRRNGEESGKDISSRFIARVRRIALRAPSLTAITFLVGPGEADKRGHSEGPGANWKAAAMSSTLSIVLAVVMVVMGVVTLVGVALYWLAGRGERPSSANKRTAPPTNSHDAATRAPRSLSASHASLGPEPLPRWGGELPPQGPRSWQKMSPKRFRAVWAVSSVVVVLVTSVGVWFWNRQSERARWSAFPHSMGCVVDRSAPEEPLPSGMVNIDPPPMARARKVTLEHHGGNSLGLSVELLQRPDPRAYGYSFGIIGSQQRVVILSVPEDDGSVTWTATRSNDVKELANSIINETPSPDIPNLLTSIDGHGKVMRFIVDLQDADKALGKSPFTPGVEVGGMLWNQSPGAVALPYSQKCQWNTPISKGL